MSIAAQLLQGLACTNNKSGNAAITQFERVLTEHEAARTVQSFWRRRKQQSPRPLKKRRRHTYSRAERSAVTAVWLAQLYQSTSATNNNRNSNNVHTLYRWIRFWLSQQAYYALSEWITILQDALERLPNQELLAVCHYSVWDIVCTLPPSTDNTTTPYLVAGVLKSLTQRIGETLLWRHTKAMEGLVRLWMQAPTALGRFVDPLKEDHSAGSSGGRRKLPTVNECCSGDEDDEDEDEDEDEDDDDDVEDNGREESKTVGGNPRHQRHTEKEDGRAKKEQTGETYEDEDDHDEDLDENDSIFEEDRDDDDDELQSMESIEIFEDNVVPSQDDTGETENVKLADVVKRSAESEKAQPPVGLDTKNARIAFFIRACTNVLRGGYDPGVTSQLMKVIQPPKKPIQTRVLLRRAPTQEEFFRGSISRNPVAMSELPGNPDPTVADLRQHIANELQMAESAELIEILVGNKIVDVNLRLRVINQVIWKEHLVGGGSNAVFSAGTISILWTSDRRVTAETPIEALPPMVATYRLTGVDGEATEDTVDHLEDPEEQDSGADVAERERIKLVDPLVVLENTRVSITSLVQKVRRDQVDGNFEIKDVPPGLQLLKLCSKIHGAALLQAGAPTVLLRWLLNLLKVSRETNEVAGLLQSLIEDLSTLDMATHSGGNSDAAKQLPDVLESIQSMDLPEALCGTVAKLLPFLTYGQPDLSRELALLMKKHICLDQLGQENTPILVKTLVQTLVNLPRDEVICDALRTELVRVGFANDVTEFILKDIPSTPPPWTKALWSKSDRVVTDITPWQAYFQRAPALRVALEVLNGVGRAPGRLVQPCHWLESTSDSPCVETHGLGLLSETLLETLSKCDTTQSLITVVRKRTRQRRKEISQERRTKALANMNISNVNAKQSALASILPRVVGLFKESPTSAKKRAIPDWMAEANSMKEETGLTCAVCHEGRTVQPNELLGLYAYVKKVAIPLEVGGSRHAIEGLNLLQALPSRLPPGFDTKGMFSTYLLVAKSAVAVSAGSFGGSSTSRRTAVYTNTVSAGTGIHFSCHRKARMVDRNHPKAPKSEWEGAALRNNRVNCNIILPLVSRQSSGVPLRAVDSALSEHHTAISNLLGSTPKSALWTVLHDVRLLLLRIAYAESLSTDCGGGSLTSNCHLVYHQFATTEIFYKDAEVDQPQKSLQARGIADALIIACLSIREDPSSSTNGTLIQATAEASTMACICSILFQSDTSVLLSLPDECKSAPSQQWNNEKKFFLQSLILLAGRRHAQGVYTSFCTGGGNSFRRSQPEAKVTGGGKANVEQFASSLRPMLTYFAMVNQLSIDYSSSNTDDVQSPAERLASIVMSCRRAETIEELLQEHAGCYNIREVMAIFQKGFEACYAEIV